MTLIDIGRRIVTTKSCRNKINYVIDFFAALSKNPSAAQWFKIHGTRDVLESITRWVAQHSETRTPKRYTVRQSPTHGMVHRPVTVVRQPNNTFNIGIPQTIPRAALFQMFKRFMRAKTISGRRSVSRRMRM